ncbi:GIN domain-containing protein [Phenylobacterium sp.]|uniref:GIN domain-containing protein n=1 Tax=Phenylobacterium sp. TaxID=1871053 RepID=UPI0027366601|nr:DUF2807 domain-containing protein [Phenylobacterium sp.]MDP3660645.1 DUF2807 domain-containing protein [Phenylobacterium sp.]
MRQLIAVAAAALVLAGGAARADSVEIRDAAARVVIIPENRRDVRVEVMSRNPRLPLTIRTAKGRTLVDGNLDRRIRDCHERDGAMIVDVGGVGPVRYADLPQVVIRTPMDVAVSAGGAVFGDVGRSASLSLASAGCGRWTIANVRGVLKLDQAGSGEIRAGGAASARIRGAGSGDIQAGAVRGPLSVDLAGSGDIAADAVQGALKVNVAGSGDVDVPAGEVAEMDAVIAGSGDVRFGGVAARLKARIAGSGDVVVRRVTGRVDKTVMGSGAVRIG